jgi:hypothetical protein
MLYALPDHQVMENLLPGIGHRRLNLDRARERLRRRPGLVPIAINPEDGGAVYFADIGDAPLVEWKHIYTIERLARDGKIDESLATDLSILEDPAVAEDGLSPHGLIFHVSRCGSTLFTKALGRSPRNLTINQGGPLQEGFWAAVTDHWRHEPEPTERNLVMLRNLVRLMARRRRPEYQRCFIKFISWNIIYLDFIRAAFPESSALYLYRDPLEVIATVLQETTAVLRSKGAPLAAMLTGLPHEDTAGMSDVEYLAHCYAHYFDIVSREGGTAGLRLVNYTRLRLPESFPAVLDRGLNLRPDADEMERMLEQYRYYSKDDSDQTLYAGESETLGDALSEADRRTTIKVFGERLARLDNSARNIFPPAGSAAL